MMLERARARKYCDVNVREREPINRPRYAVQISVLCCVRVCNGV